VVKEIVSGWHGIGALEGTRYAEQYHITQEKF